MEVLHEGYGAEVLPHEGAQYSVACAVEYAKLVHVAHNGVIDEIAYCLHCFLATHAADVDVGLEFKALSVQLFLCLAREEGYFAHFGLGCFARLEPVE